MLVFLLHRPHGESGSARVAVRQHLWCSVSDTSFAYWVIFILGALSLKVVLLTTAFFKDMHYYRVNVGDVNAKY